MLSRFALTTAASRASRRWPAVATSSLSTRSQAQTSPESDKQQGTKKSSPAARESSSFVQNIFRGIVQPEQIFPYPDVMTEDQRETLAMLLGPAERFFTEEHDSLAADAAGKVPDKTMKALADLGAFGLQVPVELGGAGLTNSQYGRVTEILGATDLGLAITLGAHQSIGFKGILILGEHDSLIFFCPFSLDMVANFAPFIYCSVCWWRLT
jgi:very long chain acyl-CoA dehydrogenase